jgi:hypothetical protein
VRAGRPAIGRASNGGQARATCVALASRFPIHCVALRCVYWSARVGRTDKKRQDN